MARLILSDKRKLITAVSLLLCLGFVVTTLVNYYVSKASIRASIVDRELPLTSDNIYSEIQKDLIRPVFTSSMMASDTFLRDWVLNGEKDVGQMTKYLDDVKQRNHAFTSFFVSERTRRYYQTGGATGILKTVRPDEPRDAWYFRVRGMQEPYEINVDVDMAHQDALTIFINYRVLDYQGNYIGATGVGLTVNAVRTLINGYQQRYQRLIYFVDGNGGIKLAGNDTRLPAANIRDIPGLRKVADEVLHGRMGSFEYKSGGHVHLLNVRYIPELNWYLFVEKVEDEALAEIRNTLYLNLAICVLVTSVVLALTSLTINRYQRRLEEMATTDKLTGLANRQAFEVLFEQALRECERAEKQLTAILIDIDHFKNINDTVGHLVGDKVLKDTARILRNNLRKSDILCRWGGEEFLIVPKECDPAKVLQLAEKLRAAIENHPFEAGGEPLRITISLGIASGTAESALLIRADKALYEAKQTGRNRVCVSGMDNSTGH